jgi:hypothetical protein
MQLSFAIEVSQSDHIHLRVRYRHTTFNYICALSHMLSRKRDSLVKGQASLVVGLVEVESVEKRVCKDACRLEQSA